MANRALKNARTQGWWVKKSSGRAKVWGVITCEDPSSVDKSARCSKIVLSTSGSPDGSETAAVIDDLLAKCCHVRQAAAVVDTELGRALDRAGDRVASAEFCVEAAEKLRAKGAHEDLMNDYLEQSLADASEAEKWLEEAEEQESLLSAAGDAARDAASAAGVSVSLGVEDLAARAEGQATDAKVILLHQPGPDASDLRNRCDGVISRVRELRPS